MILLEEFFLNFFFFILRLKVYSGKDMMMDTGCVCHNAIKGGRLGLFVFSQEKVIWSNMMNRCLTRAQEETLSQCRAS